MSPDQDPRSAIPPRSGGFRNRLRKFVRGRKSLPATPGYTLPLAQPPPPSRNGGAPVNLSIHVNIRYKHPLNVNFENAYESSRGFVPSDEVCHGLLRRLDHGCPELITRRDSSALTSSKGQKPMRYELTFTVTRSGKPWAVKVFTSYQELPLDSVTALEVAEEADRLVGPFLKLHDKAFRWQPCERLNAEPDMAVAPQGNTISLVPVPLCRFVFTKQEYESAPGYEINLVFKSQRRPRKPVIWEKRLHVKSSQTMPLTLALGEDLTWKISSALTRMLDSRRNTKTIHTSADDSDSDDTRAYLAEDSLHVDFRIRNRIGFDYSHLERSTDSRLALFQHPQGLDCEDFMIELERAINTIRDEVDSKLSRSDDLKISIRQVSGLSGTYWTVKNPFSVALDSSTCYPRHTIQAALERVQTGIEDVVRGNDVSISFAATKRGHAVLDKTIVAQSDRSSPRRQPSKPVDPDQEGLLAALKERIQRDVAMVVRDTLSLDGSIKFPANLRLTERRMDPALPSPSTLVASSHADSEEHHDPENPMSVDDVITASMARFAALDDDTSDSGETATRRHSNAETPLRPIPLIKDQQNGTAWRSTRRESITALSFATTDEGDTESTRLSTPCFSERDNETHNDSVPTTPNLSRGASHTFERFISRPDDSSIRSEDTDDMKLPRRFALLSRRRRPQTPVVETNGDGESTLINTMMGSKSETTTTIVEKPSSQTVKQAAQEDEESTRVPAKPASSPSQVETEPVRQIHSTPASPKVSSPTSNSSGPTTPLPQPKSPHELQGWLEYSAKHPPEAVKTPTSIDTSRHLEVTSPQSPTSEAEPTPTRQNGPGLVINTTLPNTPQPQTPVMSTADSVVSESPIDPSLIPLDYDEGSTPSPTHSHTSLTLWRPYGSPFIPDDFDLNALESPSKYIRPSLHPRPQSSQTNASFFSNPMSVSPTASPSTARRPYLAMHKRQFSSPTAGYLGLLHGRGSPLRMQSYVYAPHELDPATAEEDEDASASNSPLAQMQRRSSWALVALRTGKEVELAARPSSSAGLPAPVTPEMRARSGSTLSASVWLN